MYFILSFVLKSLSITACSRSSDCIQYHVHREAGIGCLASPGTTKQLDLNRAEIIKLLVTCFSESLYLSPSGEREREREGERERERGRERGREGGGGGGGGGGDLSQLTLNSLNYP